MYAIYIINLLNNSVGLGISHFMDEEHEAQRAPSREPCIVHS